MTIGERIRNARKIAGITQKQLGEKSGIAEPTIRRYELGKLNPKYETLKKIADALNVFVTDLTGNTDGPRFESNAERAAYRLNQKIKSTGASVFGKYENDIYKMWLKFRDGIVVPINMDDLEMLGNRFDRFLAFTIEEFEHEKKSQAIAPAPNDLTPPGTGHH